MIRTNLFHTMAMAFGNCFLRFRQDMGYAKKNEERDVHYDADQAFLTGKTVTLSHSDMDPGPVVHTPTSELRIRIPRVVSCTDCAEHRVLQHYELESVPWSCDDCVGGGILPLYRINPQMKKNV